MPEQKWYREKRRILYHMPDGNKCPWCEKPLLLNRPDPMPNSKWFDSMATIDHIQARADGGLNCLANMVLTCNKCNSKKGSAAEKINNNLYNQIRALFKYANIDYQGMTLKQLKSWAEVFGMELKHHVKS